MQSRSDPSVLREHIAGKRSCLEADPAARGVGREGVLDLHLAREHVDPLGGPFERLRLAFSTMSLEIVKAARRTIAAEWELGDKSAWMRIVTARLTPDAEGS